MLKRTCISKNPSACSIAFAAVGRSLERDKYLNARTDYADD